MKDALASYLKGRLPGDWDRLALTKIEGGQSNPTFILDAAAERYVLRKKPDGVLLPSAHAIDREYRIMEALAATDVPVPAMKLYCEDAGVIGTPFFVMAFVPGRTLRDPLTPDLDAAQRRAVHESMVGSLAALHKVDPAAVGLGDYGRPGGYFARQIDRWTKQYRQTETEAIPAMESLIGWLPGNIPADDAASIAHGDYRLENLLIHPTEPRVVAVLDWELSTLGHPLADLAYNCIPYHLPRRAFYGVSDVDIAGSGMPTEAEAVSLYARLTGSDPAAHWGFYMAFALFRLAAILQGVRKRALDGNAASVEGLARGALAGLCAEGGDKARAGL